MTAALLLFLFGIPAAAQTDDYQTAHLVTPLSCEDFEHRADGSWMPLHPFAIEGVFKGSKSRSTHGINTVIRKGVSIDALDLGALLDAQCGKPTEPKSSN